MNMFVPTKCLFLINAEAVRLSLSSLTFNVFRTQSVKDCVLKTLLIALRQYWTGPIMMSNDIWDTAVLVYFHWPDAHHDENY